MFTGPSCLRAFSLCLGTVGCLACLLVAGGCGPTSEIVLDQSFAHDAQQHVALTGQRTFYETAGDRLHGVLEFPLPRAADGPLVFHLFLTMPERAGEFPVLPTRTDAVRGFLIQDISDLAGITRFQSGQVQCRTSWLAPKNRKLIFDIQCEDGTRITGDAKLRPNTRVLSEFQRRYAADIASIQPAATSQPADDAPRRGTSDRLRNAP